MRKLALIVAGGLMTFAGAAMAPSCLCKQRRAPVGALASNCAIPVATPASSVPVGSNTNARSLA